MIEALQAKLDEVEKKHQELIALARIIPSDSSSFNLGLLA
jgi:hypothetical protein